MARIVKNCKAATIEELVDTINAELDENKPHSYSITTPVYATDLSYHVILSMECFG